MWEVGAGSWGEGSCVFAPLAALGYWLWVRTLGRVRTLGITFPFPRAQGLVKQTRVLPGRRSRRKERNIQGVGWLPEMMWPCE